MTENIHVMTLYLRTQNNYTHHVEFCKQWIAFYINQTYQNYIL